MSDHRLAGRTWPTKQKRTTEKLDETIWMASIPDIFGGYGIIAVGKTEQEAKSALWKVYTENTREWNGIEDDIYMPVKNLEQLIDTWGINLRCMNLGKGYFGGNDETD